MNYRVVITKLIDNPNFEEERKSWEAAHGFYGRSAIDDRMPQRQIEEQSLVTILNETQFAAVQKAVIEKMQ